MMTDPRDSLIVELLASLVYMTSLLKEAETLVQETRKGIAEANRRIDKIEAGR